MLCGKQMDLAAKGVSYSDSHEPRQFHTTKITEATPSSIWWEEGGWVWVCVCVCVCVCVLIARAQLVLIARSLLCTFFYQR